MVKVEVKKLKRKKYLGMDGVYTYIRITHFNSFMIFLLTYRETILTPH
jgi:hypothetical protein